MAIRFYFSLCLFALLILTLTANAKEVKVQPKPATMKTTIKTTTTKPVEKLSATKASEAKKTSLKSTSPNVRLAANATKISMQSKNKKAPLLFTPAKASLKTSTRKTATKSKAVEATAQKKPLVKTQLAQAKKSVKPTVAQAKKSNAIALFAVSQNQKGVFLDPIVLIESGRFTSPPTGDATTAKLAKFANTYYRAEQNYRLLFGGGEAGKVTVKQWNLRKTCSRTQATAELTSSAKISGKVMGLATNSKVLGKKERSRRFPTEKEKAAIYGLAEKAYRQKGVTAAELKDLKRINITATDLNDDGKAELIGTFMVKRSNAARIAHILFLIAEPNGKAYKVGVSQYGQITAKDVGGADKLDELGETALAEILVDQIDLDRDGTAEVIIADLTAEGVAYKIFKKQKNLWRKAYEFYNLRCAN